MLATLEQFDRDQGPGGLYALNDLSSDAQGMPPPRSRPRGPHYEEWFQAIAPYLRGRGIGVDQTLWYHGGQSGPLGRNNATFVVPGVGKTTLSMTRIAKIKVRRYGSAYMLDRHEDFRARWQALDLADLISEFWRDIWRYPPEPRLGLLLFLGFDKALRPFERELRTLEADVPWTRHDVFFFTRTWADPHARGFGVRAALWAKDATVGERASS